MSEIVYKFMLETRKCLVPDVTERGNSTLETKYSIARSIYNLTLMVRATLSI